MAEVPAQYFDGQHSRARPVTLTITDDRVVLNGEVTLDVPIEAVTFSAPVGRTPRFVRFTDGTFCEVSDIDGLARLLEQAGALPPRSSQWDLTWRWPFVALVVVIVAGVVGYRYGLPVAAGVVARTLPTSSLSAVSEQTLRALDAQVLEPSTLPPARHLRLRAGFARLVETAGTEPLRLEFRRSSRIGANALALPSHIVVVTDGLVELAGDDEEVLGVLAHEIGHIAGRHTVRNVIQSSIVAAVVAAYLGDLGGLAAAAPTALLNARYSRDFEREADDYAVAVLAAVGIAPARLADLLERLEQEQGAGGAFAALSYLSSHPPTADRSQRLRAAGR